MSDQPRNDQQQKNSESLWNDAVVEEVRAIRRRLWEASGRDVHRYIERSFEAEDRRRRERSEGRPPKDS